MSKGPSAGEGVKRTRRCRGWGLGVLASLLLIACAADIKQVEVTEANWGELHARVRAGRELTGEEVRLLEAYLGRQAPGGRLPVGRTIGDLIAEQRGFEQAAAAAAPPPGRRLAEATPKASLESSARPVPERRREAPAPPPSATAAVSPALTPVPTPTERAAPDPTPVPEVLVPAGTVLKVRLEEAVSTKTHRTGQSFQASLADDLVVAGRLVARRGSRVEGRVTESVRSGKVKGLARMSLALVSIDTGGATQALESQPLHFEARSTKGEDAKKVGIGAGAGAVIGAVTGGKKGAAIGTAVGAGAGAGVVLLTRGEEVEFGVEQVFEFRLAKEHRSRALAVSR